MRLQRYNLLVVMVCSSEHWSKMLAAPQGFEPR